MPRGASVYESGFGIDFSPRNAIASFAIEYDFGLGARQPLEHSSSEVPPPRQLG
jgi:hypothetical protein